MAYPTIQGIFEVTKNADSFSIASDGTLEASRKFKAVLRDAGGDPSDVWNSDFICMAIVSFPYTPKIHSFHPRLAGIWCTNIEGIPTEDENVYEITCKYTNIDIAGRIGFNYTSNEYSNYFSSGSDMTSMPIYEQDLPWRLPPRIVGNDNNNYMEVMQRAYAGPYMSGAIMSNFVLGAASLYTSNGDLNWTFIHASTDIPKKECPIMNTASDFWKDLPQGITPIKTYNITWAYPYISGTTESFMSAFKAIKGTVNDDDITILGIPISAYCGLVTGAEDTQKVLYGWPYYELKLTIDVRADSWWTPILNNGFNYISASTKQQFFGDGERSTEAGLLNISGGPLPSAQASNPTYVLYLLHPWYDWTKIKLPSGSFPSSYSY